MKAFCLPLLLVLTGCGTIQKYGLRSATPVFKKSSELQTTERSWEFFAESAPANLKLMELISLQDQDNLELLGILIKGYAGYSFGVPETLAFQDEMSGVENSPYKRQAIIGYTKALDYGITYFAKKGIKHQDILKNDEATLTKMLKEEMDEDDLVPVLYTAQAWGSLINLQKDNVALISQVSKVKAMFDWVCGQAPKIENNVCDIFYAQYEVSRPKMLGGNPEKGEELFLKSIAEHPQHLLIRMTYIQFSILPAYDESKYEKEAAVLKTAFSSFEDLNRDELEEKSDFKKSQHLNLFNAIAKKRFDIIEANKKKIF